MKRLGIRQFRDRLTSHLRDVEKGSTLFLTNRGKPVAMVTPVTAEDLIRVDPEATLEALAAEGKVRRGKGKFSTRAPIARRRGTPLSRIVSEHRP